MMEGELVRLEKCRACNHSNEVDAVFCSACGKRITLSVKDGSVLTAAKEFVIDSAEEAKQLGIEILKSDVGKKVAAGAAMGAAAGLIVPLVGPAIGATFGAGYVAFKRLTR